MNAELSLPVSAAPAFGSLAYPAEGERLKIDRRIQTRKNGQLMTFLAFSHPSFGRRIVTRSVASGVCVVQQQHINLLLVALIALLVAFQFLILTSFIFFIDIHLQSTAVLLVKVEQISDSSTIDSLSSWPLQLQSIGQRILFRRSATSKTSFNCTVFTQVSNYVSFLLYYNFAGWYCHSIGTSITFKTSKSTSQS